MFKQVRAASKKLDLVFQVCRGFDVLVEAIAVDAVDDPEKFVRKAYKDLAQLESLAKKMEGQIA